MTLFDIIALSLLGVSALVGFARGALREVTTVVAFVAALFAAAFGLRFIGPMARAAIHPGWLGNVVGLLVVFLVVYTILRIIGSALIRSLHSTAALGFIDRLVGGGFGLVRGLVALGVINIAIHMAPAPQGEPSWIVNAKLYPLSEKCAQVLRAVAPRGSDMVKRLTPAIEKTVNSDAGGDPSSSDGGQSGESGYDQAARKGLDDVVEKTR